MKPKRLEKFKRVAGFRQRNLTVILENVHDTHNIGAVLRSCDSVGIQEIYVLHSAERTQKEGFKLGKRTTAGTRKWVDVHYFQDIDSCFTAIRKKYDRILCSQIDSEATELHDLELAGSVALLFGNEHDGVSGEAAKRCDGSFFIPQVGMVESLNISVACAVTLYEAFRQRKAKKMYLNNESQVPAEMDALLAEYIRRHEDRFNQSYVEKTEE